MHYSFRYPNQEGESLPNISSRCLPIDVFIRNFHHHKHQFSSVVMIFPFKFNALFFSISQPRGGIHAQFFLALSSNCCFYSEFSLLLHSKLNSKIFSISNLMIYSLFISHYMGEYTVNFFLAVFLHWNSVNNRESLGHTPYLTQPRP